MAVQIIDTLKKYGNEFQSKCLAALVSDKAFLERTSDIIDKDYFESDAHKWIITEIIAYFMQYKQLPTLSVFKIRIDTIADDITKTSVIDQLRGVYTRLNDSDLKFVKEQFLEFCKNQKLKTAIMDSVDLLKIGKYESIKTKVDEALKAGMERNVGHIYLSDVDARMSEMARNYIPTGFNLIDDIMDGGLASGELGVVIGSAGGGKSWLLSKIGSEAMRQGKNVLHYTMELNENYVGLRYDACFTKIPFQDIRSNIDKVKETISKVPGKLVIKYFPIKTISPHTLKIHAERIMTLGTKIDLMIVDYADILRPFESDKNSNSYTEMGGVYEELRGVLGELQIPGWTASQSNRGAAEEDIIQGHNVADSYRKIMTADFVMSLSRKMSDKATNTARMHVIKNRFGQDGITFPTKFDASNGDIQVFDEKSKEGMLLQTEMDDGENVIKNMLSNRWNSSKKEKADDME